jgi:hypothetical protein
MLLLLLLLPCARAGLAVQVMLLLKALGVAVRGQQPNLLLLLLLLLLLGYLSQQQQQQYCQYQQQQQQQQRQRLLVAAAAGRRLLCCCGTCGRPDRPGRCLLCGRSAHSCCSMCLGTAAAHDPTGGRWDSGGPGRRHRRRDTCHTPDRQPHT